ncbi:MAG: hypothetical protein R3332_05410 [Pseudohongiellaceae bacterium]|nr:hypothetical protein [Pseudohongiellaceae bacterium]
MKPTEKPDFFEKQENINLMLKIFYGCCALLVGLDFVIDRYTYHPLEKLWGFYPVYGFVGCVVLVIIAKWMRLFLMRDEDYYDVTEEKKLAQMQSEKENNHVGH